MSTIGLWPACLVLAAIGESRSSHHHLTDKCLDSKGQKDNTFFAILVTGNSQTETKNSTPLFLADFQGTKRSPASRNLNPMLFAVCNSSKIAQMKTQSSHSFRVTRPEQDKMAKISPLLWTHFQLKEESCGPHRL